MRPSEGPNQSNETNDPIDAIGLTDLGAIMNKLQRIIPLLWAVALGAIAMLVVAAGLLLGTRKGAGR